MTQPSSSVLFREIHKNAWLKRLPVPEKKALPSIKRGMKVWVVFCVHDDVDPFLEFYLDQEQSAVHKPINSVALNQTLHVSPTICAHEDEFEFVITLQSDIVRLTASSWDQMMEWVESITGKLREMRILSPKENHYSKMPEQRPPLLPTRDPNSPLPLPPLGPASLLPGVEPVLHSDSHSDRNHPASAASVLSPVQMGMIAPSTESSEYTRGLQRLVSRISSLNDPPSELPPPPSSPSPSSSSLPTSPSPVPHNVTVIEVNAASDLPSSSSHLPSSNQQSSNHSNYSQPSHLPPPSSSQSNVPHHNAASLANNPINQPGTSREDSVFNFAFVNEALSPAGEETEVFFTPPATPGLPGSIARFINPLSGLTAGPCDPFAPLPPAGAGTSAVDPFAPRPGSAAPRATDPFAPQSETKAAGTELPGTVWDCREEDVKLWNCREGEVKVWDCREEDLQVWDCREDAGPARKSASHAVSVSSDSQINIVPPPPVRQLSRVVHPSKTPLPSVESVGKPRSPLPVPVSCSSISQVSISSHPVVSASKSSNASSQVNVKSSSHPVGSTKPATHSSSVNVITQNASTTCLSLSNTPSSVPATSGLTRPCATSSQPPHNNRTATSVSMASTVLVQPPPVSSNSGVPHPRVNASSPAPPPLSSIPSASPSSNAKPTPPPHANAKPIAAAPLSNPKSVPSPLAHPKSISPPIILNKATPSSPSRPRRNSTSNEVPPSSDVTSNGHANLYEHLFPPSDSTTGSNGEANSTTTNNQVKSTARSRPVTVNPQPNRPRRRSASNSETSGHLPHVPADRIRAVSQRSQQQPVPARHAGPTPAQGPPQSSPPDAPLVNPSRLTLREQQVLQLRREMMHPGGVRLQLRRKDCVNSIALVDAFNAVWIAGWKQKEHPMLYNALHIGDQVLKIMGQFVQNAADAQKLIRSKHGIYVEFVILRVPRGRVYALCREQQGQSLGIVQEGSAEVKDLVPGGLAAQHGIPLRCPTMDGLALTSWWITEVNGRPLNLFFKDNEVKDRLNCVGLDISLLLQPFDLIKQIRKQMKSSIRSYKDYIVQ